MQTIKTINQIIVFSLEICMIISIGFFGFQQSKNPFLKYTLAIGLPLIAISLWGILAAPKSANRLEMPYLAFFRLAMFLIAAFLLFKLGNRNYAITLAALAIISQIISYYTEH